MDGSDGEKNEITVGNIPVGHCADLAEAVHESSQGDGHENVLITNEINRTDSGILHDYTLTRSLNLNATKVKMELNTAEITPMDITTADNRVSSSCWDMKSRMKTGEKGNGAGKKLHARR